MSDFDEEAERERLREQYERDEQKREATERMSELLLKGATMTNAHCETCGDPIFRYEGQLFCPTCEEAVAEDGTKLHEGDTEADADGASESATEDDESNGDPADENDPARETTQGNTDGRSSEKRERQTDSSDTSERRQSQRAGLPERREQPEVPDRDRSPSEELRRPDPPARREEFERDEEFEREAVGGSDDPAQAEASLQRSLLRFARAAERAEDPRRAREHLEAASEAADALVSVSELQ